jgi:hypothetical protein
MVLQVGTNRGLVINNVDDSDDDNDSSHDGDESMETVISTDIDPATGTCVYENVSKQKK